MSDPAIVAAYQRAFARACQTQVTFQRVVGQAPNATVTSATVNASVTSYIQDTQVVSETGSSSSKIGAITQGDRLIMVLGADLTNAGFPLPLKKNDKILLPVTGDLLNIKTLDPFKRDIGDAIEVVASGVK